jgi:hypothetical protein
MECRLRAQAVGVRSVAHREGRLVVEFVPEHVPSPRVFSILAVRNPGAALGGERYLWPFAGDALAAVGELLSGLEKGLAEVEEQRAALNR